MLYVTFHNDSTGTQEIGNYNVQVWINQKLLWVGRLEKHERSLGWQELLRKFVSEVCPSTAPSRIDAGPDGVGNHSGVPAPRKGRKRKPRVESTPM